MLFCQGALLLSYLYLVEGSAVPWGSHHGQSAKEALYLQTNAVEGNSIVAIPILGDGKLGSGAVYPTKGKGSNSINGGTMKPMAPDSLLSQSAVAIAGNHLFTTNAGSNSVSAFSINKANAVDLTYLSTTSIKDGQFPNTLAASAKHKLVCVATTGKVNGISCANFDRQRGMSKFDALRPLGLNQTTPPMGPPNTVSQLAFTADEKFLIATVKADPTTMKPGFVAVYAVEGSQLSCDPVRSEPQGTAILFGFSQIPHSDDFLVSDASFGAAVLSLDAQSREVSTLKIVNITGQMASCWAAYSPATGTGFIADGAIERLVEISVPAGEIVSETNLAMGDPGLFDMVAVGEHLYVSSPGNGTKVPAVIVLEAKTKKSVQRLDLGDLGVTSNVDGLVAFA